MGLNEIPEIPYVEKVISEECDKIKDLLIRKNRSYGNSANEPIGIFYKGGSVDAINVRIDDKLKRIRDGSEFEEEDTETDLIGYLLLRRVIRIMRATA